MLGKLNTFQIERLFLSQINAHLGCHADGKTYVIPISYVYHEGKIFGYTIEGMKIEMMRKNPEVCIQVEDIRDNAHWQSAIAWGRYRELSGNEADEAIRLFSSRLHPYRNTETNRPKHRLEQVKSAYNQSSRMIAFEIAVTEMTGRFEKAS